MSTYYDVGYYLRVTKTNKGWDYQNYVHENFVWKNLEEASLDELTKIKGGIRSNILNDGDHLSRTIEVILNTRAIMATVQKPNPVPSEKIKACIHGVKKLLDRNVGLVHKCSEETFVRMFTETFEASKHLNVKMYDGASELTHVERRLTNLEMFGYNELVVEFPDGDRYRYVDHKCPETKEIHTFVYKL